jgi:hypothetical protein
MLYDLRIRILSVLCLLLVSTSPLLGVDGTDELDLAKPPAPGVSSPFRRGVTELANDADALEQIRMEKDPERRKELKAAYGAKVGPHGWAYPALGSSAAFATALLYKFIEHPSPYTAAAVTAAAAVAIFPTDYANAEFHYRQDNTWWNSPFRMLRDLATSGRRHHEESQRVLQGSYLERIAEFKATLPIGMAMAGGLLYSGAVGKLAEMVLVPLGLATPGSVGPAFDMAASAFLGSFFFIGTHGTFTHMMAHVPEKQTPRWYRVLQNIGAALSFKAHMKHHKKPFNQIYSTQSGIFDRFRGPEYWDARMLADYEKSGGKVFPGTWIQSPDNIPEKVRNKLIAEYEKNVGIIPLELWRYAPKGYPERVPEELMPALEFVQQPWRTDFLRKSVQEFQRLAKTQPQEAEEAWLQEQTNFPWIYGPKPQPLANFDPLPEDVDAAKPRGPIARTTRAVCNFGLRMLGFDVD